MKGLTRKEAIAELHKLFNKDDSMVYLVLFEQFNRYQKLRSQRHKSFHVLCHKHTYKHAGWLVCQYAMSGSCPLSSALLTFNTASGGTGRFERHMQIHKKVTNTVQTLPRAISAYSKRDVARAAAMAVALDIRPLLFTENKKGLSCFADASFRAGQATAASDNVDPHSILPSAKTVASALSFLAKESCEKLKARLPDLVSIGGGVSTDGVTLQVQDKQFYDLTLHFISVSSRSPFDMAPKFLMECRTLLLQEKKGNGGADQIRSLLKEGLSSLYGMDIDTLTKGFTMVTDNGSVMARVAGASVSARVAPMCDKWMGCLVHQINTVKCCIDETAKSGRAYGNIG